jgi:glutamyl/glutaminyl-tRNA synthetase
VTVRVRFAPSPTGSLHLGNALTAVANRRFADAHGGTFTLRIDDTDAARRLEGGEAALVSDLEWLGLAWDRGPVRQSERGAVHAAAAHVAEREGGAVRDADGSLRLDGVTLVRPDGTATYQLATVADDVEMGITHIIRGSDHRPNEALQQRIARAIGSVLPEVIHHGLLLGDDGKKLSKRHGAQSLDEFRDMGYYAPALMNFLALLGWSYDDKTTIMSEGELIERFSFDRVQASPAVFDYQKLDWMNGVYIRELPEGEFADRLIAYLRDYGYDWDEELIRRSAPLVQEKISTLGAYPEFAGFLFHDVEPDPALLDGDVLGRAAGALEGVEPFTADRIEAALRSLAEELELSPRKAFQPIRVAVTGSKVSPGLFESLELLGKEQSLARIRSR